jgi:glycosyltransferase involved in cell wall biosynthesis
MASSAAVHSIYAARMTSQSPAPPGGHPGDVSSPKTDRNSQAESRYAILSIATEWSSIHGGLSTFNRQLCCALVVAGARVVCVVLQATSEERADAERKGVLLAEAPKSPGIPELFALAAKPALPKGFTPNVIIGHGRVTGPAAQRLRDEHYSAAKRAHFIHMAPDEIEWDKLDRADDAGERAEQRTELELFLARTADLVVAVGPKLHGRLQNDLDPYEINPLCLDPGFDAENIEDSRSVPPGLWRILLFGRMEEAFQKGLDLAARAVGLAMKRRETTSEEIEFVIRGAPPNSSNKLREKIRELSDLPSLNVVVRPYSTKEEQLTADLRRASLVLMPSRREGFGLVGVEAIIAGTPVLISRSSGLGALLRETLQPEEAGRIVVSMSGDDEEIVDRWARAIEAVLRDRDAAFRRAAEARRYLSEHKKWSTAVQMLLTALDLPPAEGQATERSGDQVDLPPPDVSQDEAPVVGESAGDPHIYQKSPPDRRTLTRALNERRLQDLDRALKKIAPGIYRNSKRRVTRLEAATTALLSVDPIIQALSAAVEAEKRQPALQKLQELEFNLQQHYITVSQRLSSLKQVRSEEDAVQPCQDLAGEAAELITACNQAIQRVT